MVPSRVKQDQRLRAWDHRVLLTLLELSHKTTDGDALQPVTVRAQTVARLVGDASRSGRELARRSLLRLEKFGYLARRPVPGRTATYDLNPAWSRPPLAEMPRSAEPTPSAAQETGSPETVSRPRTDNRGVVTTDNPGVVTADNRRVVTNISESSYSYKGQAEQGGLSEAGLHAGLQMASQILGCGPDGLEPWWIREALDAFAQMPRARHPDRAFAGFMEGEARKRAGIVRRERSIPQL